jgi:hypothetical protein
MPTPHGGIAMVGASQSIGKLAALPAAMQPGQAPQNT